MSKGMHLYVRPQDCVGCRSCELVCSLEHEGSFFPAKARIEVLKWEPEGHDEPVVCRQCSRPLCVESCPRQALKQDVHGVITVLETCDGCRTCAAICPFRAIRFYPGYPFPLVCDLCGGQPACVERCVTGALRCVTTQGVRTAPMVVRMLPIGNREG